MATLASLLLVTLAGPARAATDPGDPGAFSVTKQTLQIPATQGATLDTDVHYPGTASSVDPNACPCPVVVFGHGFSRSKERYVNLGAHLASRGFIVLIPNFAGGSDHGRNADDLSSLLDWVVARNADPSSIFHARVDTAHVGSSGHSAGGLSSLLAASRDARITAVASLDPVDSNGLGVAAMPSITVPVAINYSEQSSCNTGSGAVLYGAAGAPRRGVKVVNGTHCDPEDPTDFLCELLCGAADAARQRLYRKYVTGWYEYYLHCDASYATYVHGAAVQADVTAGVVTYDADLTPAAPAGLTATGAGCAIQIDRAVPLPCGLDGWTLLRSTTAGGGYTPVAQLAPTTSSYSDTAVTPGTAYYYVARDIVGAFTSGDSNEASATPSTSPPSADFTGAPRTGAAPLFVTFQDTTSGSATSWQWSFGDGGAATSQSPSHTYQAAGSYDVSLTVTGACGSDTETKPGFVVVTNGTAADDYLAGPGPGAANPNRVRLLTLGGGVAQDLLAYAAGGYGTRVAAGEIDGGLPEAITGPGPGAVFGPQVRAFASSGPPLGKVNFFAYGTLRFGVDVAGGDLDGDAFAEIATGGGPGAVFGPHVRAFDFDGGPLTGIAKINFFAYGTLKYGVRVAAGDLDGDGFAELVTGPGPSPQFAPQVRGFDYDGTRLTAISRINANVFATTGHGAHVALGDVTGDGAADGLFGPGPGPANPAELRGFELRAGPPTALLGLDVVAFGGLGYGLEPSAGDVDADGAVEVIAGQGAAPAATSRLRSFDYDATTLTAIPQGDFEAFSLTYGVAVASGAFGY